MRLFRYVVFFLAVALAWRHPAVAAEPPLFQADSFVLENGLQVVVIPQRRVPIVTHMIWYKVGSADEEQGRSGLAHFFEHLMFKATSSHKAGELDAAVMGVGGSHNAMTSDDYTAYFQVVPPTALEEMMAFEADRMRNLVLTDDVIEVERRVVMEERLGAIDNRPAGVLNEAVDAALFQNHPYGRQTIGWMHEIEAITRDELVAFYDRYYRPNNAVLVVAGDVDTETVKTLAQKTYGKVQRGPDLPPRVRPGEPEPRVLRRLELRDSRVTLPTFSRKWFAPAYFSEKGKTADALMVLGQILGGGVHSRLYRELVVTRKIAASVGAGGSNDTKDFSFFSVSATPLTADKLPEIEQAVEAAIAKIAEEGVSEEELATTKKVFSSQLVLQTEHQVAKAFQYGLVLLTGGTVDDINKTHARIEAVTVDDIREAARDYLTTNRGVTAYLLPQAEATE